MGVVIENSRGDAFGLASGEYDQLLHLVALRGERFGIDHLRLRQGEKIALTTSQTELLATTLRRVLERGELVNPGPLTSIERLDLLSAWGLLEVLESGGPVEVLSRRKMASPIRRFPKKKAAV
jgi:hypothetical protein